MVVSANKDNGQLAIEARLFADVDDEAAAIAAKGDKGFPWQLSVGIWPASIEEVLAGASIPLNGTTLRGPLTIFRNSRIREVSVCAIGADRGAAATILNAGETINIPFITHEESSMKLDEAQAKITELEAEVERLKAQHAELSAKAPDPAKYAPVEVVQAMQTELSALRNAQLAAEVDGLVKPALADGRLLPAQESWARELGLSNLAALQSFLATAQPIAALKGTQTGGHEPGQSTGHAVDASSEALSLWNSNQALRAEFGSLEVFSAYHQANAQGLIKIYGETA